jgi:hypothetical protein
MWSTCVAWPVHPGSPIMHLPPSRSRIVARTLRHVELYAGLVIGAWALSGCLWVATVDAAFPYPTVAGFYFSSASAYAGEGVGSWWSVVVGS